MVVSEEKEGKSMAITPNELKWGNHRKRRAVRRSSWWKNDNSTTTRKWNMETAWDDKRQVVSSDDANGIGAVREKLMLDLKTEADKIKNVILKNEEEEKEPVIGKCTASVADRGDRCPSPVGPAGGMKLPTLRSCSHKTERVKFSVQLSKKEIEDDFMAITGRKPPLRPKKRPRAVQKPLDFKWRVRKASYGGPSTLFPGLWLSEITADSYKILEDDEKRKVRHSRKKNH